jgi:hypothetical protein
METVESVIKGTNSQILLTVGRQVCPQAPAGKHWDNRAEPKYFRNPETLHEAICKAWQEGDFRQKRIIILGIDREW